jgi:hypothetical protein
MITRFLPYLNTLGCIAITTIIIIQWHGEHQQKQIIQDLNLTLAKSQETEDQAKQKVQALETDIAALKEALQATQQTANANADQQGKIASALDAEMTKARDQMNKWQQAILERDERIRTLQQDLIATRQRLDQAISKLKQKESP